MNLKPKQEPKVKVPVDLKTVWSYWSSARAITGPRLEGFVLFFQISYLKRITNTQK